MNNKLRRVTGDGATVTISFTLRGYKIQPLPNGGWTVTGGTAAREFATIEQAMAYVREASEVIE